MQRKRVLVALILVLVMSLLAACGESEVSGNPDMPKDPSERENYYSDAPPMQIDTSKIYQATLVTDKGDIVIELYAEKAPVTVNNFVFLAREGYYNNTTFHRVIEDFMAQAGDPTGTGYAGPGYYFEDEFDSSLKHDGPGVVSMANIGQSGTNGSQFFITFVATPWLDGQHTVFGQVIEGLDVLFSLSIRDPQTATERGDVIKIIRIDEVETSALPTPTPINYAEPGEIPMPEDPVERVGMYYGQIPAMVIDTSKSYMAILETENGEITIELYDDEVPNTVNNFVFLAREGYFDGITFHRVIEGFMAQSGDPGGTGAGGPGYMFEDEFDSTLRHDGPGVLSMANSGPGTNGSQFFITFEATPWLDDMHSVFGKVVEGLDVLNMITIRDPNTATTPGDVIKSIRIIEE